MAILKSKKSDSVELQYDGNLYTITAHGCEINDDAANFFLITYPGLVESEGGAEPAADQEDETDEVQDIENKPRRGRPRRVNDN